MAWIKLDDGFMEHEKVVTLRGHRGGKDAIIAHLEAMCWASRGEPKSRRRTHGHIPAGVAPSLGATPRIAGLLESAGLWDRNGDGWYIHDWQDYQRADTTAAERKRRQRDRDANDA